MAAPSEPVRRRGRPRNPKLDELMQRHGCGRRRAQQILREELDGGPQPAPGAKAPPADWPDDGRPRATIDELRGVQLAKLQIALEAMQRRYILRTEHAALMRRVAEAIGAELERLGEVLPPKLAGATAPELQKTLREALDDARRRAVARLS